MRAVTRLSRASLGGPIADLTLRRDATVLRGLRRLIVPTLRNGVGSTLDLEGPDLAALQSGPSSPHTQGGGYRRVTGSPSTFAPAINEDRFGAFWDFDDTSATRAINLGGGSWAYDPAAAGGFQGITKFAVFMRTANLSTFRTLFVTGVSGNAAQRMWLGISNATYCYWGIGSGTATLVTSALTTPALMTPYVFLATSRASNDHEIALYNLLTGAVVSVGSVTNCGTSGLAPDYSAIGAVDTPGTPSIPSQGMRIYGVGQFDRGLGAADFFGALTSIADLWRPSIPRLVVTDLGPPVGTLEQTEAPDTLAATASVVFSGDLAATEGADGLAATGQVGVGVVGSVGDLVLAEADDALDSEATVDVIGALAMAEDADALAAFAQVGSTGPFAIRPTLHFT